MSNWSLSDINWNAFDASKVAPELVSLAKSACMVEHNGRDYARYLCEVFADDEDFQQVAHQWAAEEVQHGQALRKWAELADPSFDFDESFKAFTDGYKLPANINRSVRGSRSGELIARCVVESGTSTYYTAMSESTQEPVLKQISAHIAADEFRHYKLFYTHLKRYLEKEKLSAFKRFIVALGRITESGDDELAYAFYTSHHGKGTQGQYNRKLYAQRYLAQVAHVYRKEHVDRLTAMVMKAVGLKPNGRLNQLLSQISWQVIQFRRRLAVSV